MGIVTNVNAPDAVEATLRHYVKNRSEDIQTELVGHPMAKRVIQRRKKDWREGTEWEWKLTVDTNDPYTRTSLYETTPTDVGPLKANGRVPVKYAYVYFSFDDREEAFNRGEAAIYNLVKDRSNDARKSAIVGVENDFWGAPADQTTDAELKKVYGLAPYCLIASSISDGGFNGGNHTAFSSGVGNISTSDYPNWANWNFGYRDISEDDFLYKAELAWFRTNFEMVVDDVKTVGPKNRDCEFFTTWYLQNKLVRIVRGRNQDLGTMLDVYNSAPTFGGRAIMAVPWLQANCVSSAHATWGLNPFIAVNWNKTFPLYHPDYWWKWGKMKESATQEHVWNKFMDCAWNLIVVNRREGCWVGNQLTS